MTATPTSRPTRRGATSPAPSGPPVRRVAAWHVLVLGGLLVVVTLWGLLVPGTYPTPPGVRETLDQVLRGQDLVTLLAAGALVWGGFASRRGSLRGHVVWLAVCLYAAYTYLMYVVAPYNDLFLAYVAIISLASLGLADGLVRLRADAVRGAFPGVPRRLLAWFLIVTGTGFALVWIAQNLAALPGGVPEGLFAYDIPSVVHVLDLAYVLPLVVASGVLLLRRHPMAPVLAVLVLVKTLTLGLALVSMNAFVAADGAGWNVGETVVWAVIAVVAAAFLTVVLRDPGEVADDWLRPTVW